jgi:hypothetical protein
MPDNNTMIRNASGQIDLFKMLMAICMSLITAGIIAFAQNFLEVQVSIAEINKDILNLSVILEKIGEDSIRRDSAQYTGSQAVADWRLQASVDSIQDSALERFNGRMDVVEERISNKE